VGTASSVNKTDVRGAQRLLAEGAQLIDVLPASIFEQEHLPGALSLPLESMSADAIADLDRTRTYVVYCFDQH
jgi:rhodanese-related sulfurtransferase